MLNIDKLLKKKGWTGEELGRLELVNTLDVFKQSIEGVKEPKPIISKTDMQKMIGTLKDPLEGRVYNGYISIHEWFSKSYSNAVAYQQQAMLNYNTLMNVVENAISAEDIYCYISELPAIMTEKQYKDLVAKHREERLHPEDGEVGFNVFNMLDEAITYYVGLLKKEPRKKNPLRPLKKKLEREPVTDAHILTRYNETWGRGYYILSDGTRSDKTPSDEWEALVTAPEITEVLESLDKKGMFISPVEGMGAQSAQRDIARGEPFYGIKTDKEAEWESIKDTMPFQWHYYDAPPEGLKKWEIIESGDLGSYYPSLWGQGTEEEQLEDAGAFIEEFPDVVTTMLKDMERYVKGISSIPVEEWFTTVYAWEDLYKVDYYGFRNIYVDSDDLIFEGNRRALFNGIAILRPSDIVDNNPRIDPDTGYYKPPDIRTTLANFSLEGLFTDAEHYATNVETIDDARTTFLESYYFIRGYNLALDLVAQYYKLEELKVAKQDLDYLDRKIEDFNVLADALYAQIKSTYYDDSELKSKKLEVLNDVLYPIDTSTLVIPDEAIQKAKSDLKDFKAFTEEMSDLILTLCYMD